MIVRATSDLHGVLPEIEPCDLLLVGGDVCPVNGSHKPSFQRRWLKSAFTEWLEEVPADQIVGIAGNHDFVMEKEPWTVRDLPWKYLRDEVHEVDGLRIWGTPWVPNLPNWAFHGGMVHCGTVWESIPDDIDIVLAHGPMRGYGDRVGINPIDGTPQDVGCPRMWHAINRIKPQVFVCGHIHEGYGHYRHPDVEGGVYNVAHMNGIYEPVNDVVEIDLPG